MSILLALLLLAVGFLGVGTDSSSSTTSTTVTPAPTCGTGEAGCAPAPTRLSLTWSGGFDGQPEQTITITDPARLAALAAYVPASLPDAPVGPTGCADCRSYHLEIDTGGETVTYDADDANLPEGLAPLIAAMRD